MTARVFRLNVVAATPLYAGYTPTIYAAPTALGNGSGSSEANATTLQAALASATAGAIIGVLPGIYSKSSVTDSWVPAWQPTNSGSAGNPIRIVAKYPAVHLSSVWSNADRSELRNGFDGVTNGTGCATFGSQGRNYVQWIGLCVDAIRSGSRTEKAPVVLYQCTGVEIHQCEIRGTLAGWSDNWSGIRFQDCDGGKALDNRIYGFYDAGGSHGWGILMYSGINFEIAHNEVYDCYGGICPKGVVNVARPNGPGTIHHNLVMNVTVRHFLVMDARPASGYCDFYQNVAYVSNRFGMSFAPVGANSPLNVRFVNNTVVNCGASAGDGAFYVKPYSGTGYQGCVAQNNVFASNYAAFLSDGNDLAPFAAIDRNLYSTATRAFNSLSFSQFQAPPHSREANGAVGDPLFVNAAARDYRLQAGSPALTLGRDLLNLTGTPNAVIPAGAYITGSETIGIRL